MALLFCIPVISVSASLQASDLPVPVFTVPDELLSTAGHVRLSWDLPAVSAPQAVEFELQKTADATFREHRTIYSGPDRASFLSGLPDGEYRFRVRVRLNGEVGRWSAPVTVRVQHQSLDLAFILLGLGAIVVIATIGVVVFGNRQAEIE